MLRRVRLPPGADHEFVETLLEDNGGRENPLLPLLTELVLDSLCCPGIFRLLYDALMKRVE